MDDLLLLGLSAHACAAGMDPESAWEVAEAVAAEGGSVREMTVKVRDRAAARAWGEDLGAYG